MIPYETLNDQQLFEMHIKKDDKAYTEIFARYWNLLLLYTHGYLKNKEEAADIVQDVFYSFYKLRETLSASISLKAYLYRAAKNKLINISDREPIISRYLIYINQSLMLQSQSNTTDQETLLNELIGLIDKEVSEFPERMREIYELSRNQLLKNQEIAEKLDISVATVDKQMQKALKRLRLVIKRNFLLSTIMVIYLLYKIMNFFS